MTKNDIFELLWENPIEVGHWVGFKDLTDLHNHWLKMFLFSEDDMTLQGHRGSYKTTTLALFFALHIVIKPNETVLFFRKTTDDVAEVLRTTSKILQSGCIKKMVKVLYNKDNFTLLTDNSSAIHTNLSSNTSGTFQLTGLGIGTSITGKHADIIVTDDIVNISDRMSQAERERTKLAYQELQNICNRGGRFINTGTPWHKEDCFTLMPNIIKFDCYSTGLMTQEEIEYLRANMVGALFAANYELRHIASDDVIFQNPQFTDNFAVLEHGTMHLDSAFFGQDYTAWSIMAKKDGKYYLYGRCIRKHVEDCYDEIMADYERFMCSKLYNEDNADKGMVGKDLRKQGARVILYHERMNKYLKIVTYLKAIWKDLYFVTNTDHDYVEQIVEYYEAAAHDDAPDSAASLARILYDKKDSNNKYEPIYMKDVEEQTIEYKPIFMGG